MVPMSDRYMNDSHQGMLYLILGISNFKLIDVNLSGMVVLTKKRHRIYGLEFQVFIYIFF
jgi:hypothetical protein